MLCSSFTDGLLPNSGRMSTGLKRGTYRFTCTTSRVGAPKPGVKLVVRETALLPETGLLLDIRFLLASNK